MTNIMTATINIENNVITLQGVFGERFEFDMNEYRTLPQWAEKEFNKLHFTKQIGSCMFFE
jgi:hypothetical protein